MYKRRLLVFIFIFIVAGLVCIGRLAYLQLVVGDDYRSRIEEMRILGPMQLPTIRGSIFDRSGNVLAVDKPAFYLYLNYELTKFLDDSFWRGRILELQRLGQTAEEAEANLRKEFEANLDLLWELIDKCSEMGRMERSDIEARIFRINDRIWNMRRFFAWLGKFGDSPLRDKYNAKGQAVPVAEALKDFENRLPDPDERLGLTMGVDLEVMHQAQQLMELETESELLRAQLEFVDTDMVEILARAKRFYPYGPAASQVIGWVGPARSSDKELFANDRLRRYLDNELSGKDGVERVCEVVLRGRRGEVIYDIDSELVSRSETQFGKDVRISLDIKLQKEIESHLSDPNFNASYGSAIGAVVIDVATSDILALVSMPVYDLNTIRSDYERVRDSPGAPLVNKAIYEIYPPGSSIKPIVLIAGLEEGKITPDEVISCPFEEAPRAWPSCWLFREGSCHDWSWAEDGGNNARNAIRGSCNIYFSRLADRLAPAALQRWLYNFGYGREILPAPVFNAKWGQSGAGLRNLSQSAGQISTSIPRGGPKRLEEYPRISKYDMRMFGIGQSGMRATVLQVANAMAAIARGGIYKNPRLFLNEEFVLSDSRQDLGISQGTLEVVRDGMSAVVNERGGTAYPAFDHKELRRMDLKVFGKTGSTEGEVNAWFAGFAEDAAGRVVSVAVVVEGGQSGAKDAAPLARDIITLCNRTGYIGRKQEE